MNDSVQLDAAELCSSISDGEAADSSVSASCELGSVLSSLIRRDNGIVTNGPNNEPLGGIGNAGREKSRASVV